MLESKGIKICEDKILSLIVRNGFLGKIVYENKEAFRVKEGLPQWNGSKLLHQVHH